MPDKYVIVTTAQVERTYHVEADSPEQAEARLRAWIKDADSLREGIVTKQAKEQDKTSQKRVGAPKKLPATPPAKTPVARAGQAPQKEVAA